MSDAVQLARDTLNNRTGYPNNRETALAQAVIDLAAEYEHIRRVAAADAKAASELADEGRRLTAQLAALRTALSDIATTSEWAALKARRTLEQTPEVEP